MDLSKNQSPGQQHLASRAALGGTTGMKGPVVHGSYESYSSNVYYIYIYYISLDFNRFHDISITRDLDGFDVSLTCIFLGQLLNWKPQVV